MKVIKDFPLLEITEDVIKLAEKIITEKIIPEKAIRDALHIAVATFNEINFLLSCEGLELPVICTPEILLERS